MLYGRLKIKNGEVIELQIHSKKIRFERQGKVIKYLRMGNDGVEFETSIIDGDIVLYPCTYAEQVKNSEYAYLRLQEPINLAANSGLRLYIKCSVDVGIYAIKNSKYGFIDLVKDGIKYAVYGPVDSGILARYFKVKPQFTLPHVGLGDMIYVINVRNYSGSWIKFSKLVIPLYAMRVYLWNDVAISEVIYVILRSTHTADVILANKVPHPKAVEIPTLPRQALKYITFSMKWGV